MPATRISIIFPNSPACDAENYAPARREGLQTALKAARVHRHGCCLHGIEVLPVPIDFTRAMPDARLVRRAVRILTALLLALVAVGAPVAACEGWAATPAARMACCADGATCPMREGHGDMHAPTQAAADSCCAASESDPPAPAQAFEPASPALIEVASLVVDLAAPFRPLSSRRDGRAAAPAVPRHLLLSVLLV